MKRLVVVGYAINGRGMGHIVRQLAILRWIRRYSGVLGVRTETWLLTSSEADTLARREGIPALKIPSKAMMRDAGLDPARYLAVARTWVLNAIAGLQPDLLVVDTFPAGSFGELVSALELAPHRALVARPVRDEIAAEQAYQALLPLYERVIVPGDAGDPGDCPPVLIREREELLGRDEARQALGVPEGRRAVYVSLGGGGDPAASRTLPRLVTLLRDRGWYVVVGAGPLYTGEELRGEGIAWLDRYVAMELLPGVDAAVSAGGYNSFHELMHAGIPTVFLPQPRIADDQAARVRRAVEAGAARQARALEEVPRLLEEPGSAEAARALVPESGARAAAVRLLSLVLPAEDVASAARAFGPGLLSSPTARSLDPARLLDLVRLLVGEAPSAWQSRRAAVLELADQGLAVPELPEKGPPAGNVERFLAACDAHRVPPDLAVQLLQHVARRFPAARGQALVDGCAALWATWARFDDWMGALALLRAVPTQRGYALSAFAADLEAWLRQEQDLFDALRSFTRLEGGGERTVAEALRLLAQAPPSAPRELIG